MTKISREGGRTSEGRAEATVKELWGLIYADDAGILYR